MSDTSLEAPAPAKPTKRQPTKKVEWELVQEFSSKSAAVGHLKEEGIWAHHYTNKPNRNGVNSIFRCINAPRRGPQCQCKRKIECPDNVTTANLYRSAADHDHDNATTGTLTKEAKEKIQELVRLKLSTNLIWTKYARDHLASRRQLYNYLARIKKPRDEDLLKLSYGDIEKWCASRVETPKDLNTPFVLSFYADMKKEKFGVLISTCRLIEIAAQSPQIHADGTYNLIWGGFPVIVLGVTDSRKKFCLTAIAVCSGETAADYEFAFHGLKDGMKSLNSEHKFR